MKIFCIFVVIITTFNFFPMSAQDQKNSESFMEVQMLINSDLDDNYRLIWEKSKDLTQTQKLFIYDDKKKTSGLPFVLNFLVGYGIGSWIQGHTTGGLIGTIGVVGGLVLMFATDDESTILIGAITYLGSWIIDCILPFTYSSSYNRKLKNALGVSGYSNINISPIINMTQNGNIAPGVRLSVGF